VTEKIEPLTAEEQEQYVADANHLLSHRIALRFDVTNLALRVHATVEQLRARVAELEKRLIGAEHIEAVLREELAGGEYRAAAVELREALLLRERAVVDGLSKRDSQFIRRVRNTTAWIVPPDEGKEGE